MLERVLLRRRIVTLPGLPDGHIRVVEVHSPISFAAARRIVRGQDAPERLSEFRIKNRIYDRIKCRVRVSQPGEYFEGDTRYAGLAERCDNVHAEKRHPAEQKRAHDHSDRDGRFVVGDMIRRGTLVMDGRHRGCGARQRPGYRFYVLHVLLGVAVQSTVDA